MEQCLCMIFFVVAKYRKNDKERNKEIFHQRMLFSYFLAHVSHVELDELLQESCLRPLKRL